MYVISAGLGLVSPPYGIILFAAMGILRLPFHEVVMAVLPFLPALVVGLFLVTYVPQISMFLPHLIH